jgi:hypothetical protein
MSLKDNPKYLYVHSMTDIDPVPEKVVVWKNQHTRQARELLRKRTQKNPPAWRWACGYNSCTGYFTGGLDTPEWSGSSLNRKKLTIEEKLRRITANLMRVVHSFKELSPTEREVHVSRAIDIILGRQAPSGRGGDADWISAEVSLCICGIHVLSQRSKAKIKDKAIAFYRSCPGSRRFITLTFIEPISDTRAITMLNSFLTQLRKNYKRLEYLWVAERQENGNIHFHMIINQYLPVKKYNGLWVLTQYNAGLRGKDKYGIPISLTEVQDRYKAGTIQRVLNPLDARKINSIHGLSNYLTQYVTKQSEDNKYGCAVWHCTRQVSRLFTRVAVGPSCMRRAQQVQNWRLDKKTGELIQAASIRGAFHVVQFFGNKQFPLQYLRGMEQANKWIMDGFLPDSIPRIRDDQYGNYYCNPNSEIYDPTTSTRDASETM